MEQFLEYAKSLSSSEEVLNWLNTSAKKALGLNKTTLSELEHVIDWMNSPDAPKRLQKMSLVDAKRLSSLWMEKNKAKGRNLNDSMDDVEPYLSFDDESSIVILKTKKAFAREGYLMSHCLGGYSLRDGYELYSLRDKENLPHATFEISRKNKDILQIKGKGNGPIHPKYIHRVLAFLKKLGLEIRSSEMKNLGYYEIHKEHLNFVRKNINKNEQIVELNNVFYLV